MQQQDNQPIQPAPAPGLLVPTGPTNIIANALSAHVVKDTHWRRVYREAMTFDPNKNFVEIPEKVHVAAFYAHAINKSEHAEYYLGLMMVIQMHAPKPTNAADAEAMRFLDKCLTVLKKQFDA